MPTLEERDDARFIRSEAARIAAMPQHEYIVKSRLWDEETGKRSAERRERLNKTLPTPLTTDFEDYLASLGDGSRTIEGLRTGIESIDHLIGGLNRFVLMAARAGTGKSTLAIQIALGVAATENIPILYYSFEMDRSDIYTMMMQNLRRDHNYKLTRNEIVLNGRNPGTSQATKLAIQQSAKEMIEIGKKFHVISAHDGDPSIEQIERGIIHIKKTFDQAPLVVIDSIQDLVKPDQGGATQAEALVAQKIVELQQATSATFLAISQKAKGSNIDDPYAGVLGSVAMIHKPTAVVELRGVHDLIRAVKDTKAASDFRKCADLSDIPRPVVMSVLKGRNNGYGHAVLKHYGRYSYFEEGRIPDYDVGQISLYDINGIR